MKITPVLFTTCFSALIAIGLSQPVTAFDKYEFSRNPEDWYAKVVSFEPEGDVVTATVYVFQQDEGVGISSLCDDDCPYALPPWDEDISYINTVLAHIGLQPIKSLVKEEPPRTYLLYTDPNYANGEISIYVSRKLTYPRYRIWKIGHITRAR